jgi:hypothetical protein
MSITIIAFLQYKNFEVKNKYKEFLDGGKVLYACHNVLQQLGEPEPEWHEIIFIRYSEEQYHETIERLNTQKPKLINYKVLLIDPLPEEHIQKINELMGRLADSSTDKSNGEVHKGSARKVVHQSNQQSEAFNNRDDNQPLGMVILNKYDNLKALSRYGSVVGKYLAKYGVYIGLRGNVLSTVVGNKDISWDGFNLVRYPSVAIFKKIFSFKDVRESLDHKDNSLVKTEVYATLPYDEFL